MNRVFHRPMFRKGGSTNEGITSGLRQGYQDGKLAQVQQDLAILNQLAPAPKPRGSRALNNFLINFGLNLASQSPQGGFLSTAASAAQEPFGRFQQEKMYEGAASDKAASAHRSTVVLIRKSLMSKESLKTDQAMFNETVDTLFNQNLKDINFKGNNLAARSLAEHEAKVIHNQYPKELIDQFDTQTTYIDSVYVDVDADGNMKLNDVGKNVGYRPNKIYFNISDKSFYKLGADGLTFTQVDIADFQD